nr:MAG TPA: hypothetical protein [Caudoviricetes sp.]
MDGINIKQHTKRGVYGVLEGMFSQRAFFFLLNM